MGRSRSQTGSPGRKEHKRSRSRSKDRFNREIRPGERSERRAGQRGGNRDRYRSRSRSPRAVRRSRSRSPGVGSSRRRRSFSRGRSRSGSRPRGRRGRSGSRASRDRTGRRRSISPRSRSDSKELNSGDEVAPPKVPRKEFTAEQMKDKTEEEIEMMNMMGFGGFDSTKGKRVPGNDVSAVNVIHKRKYRQYMNRKGGFNRPLDFVA